MRLREGDGRMNGGTGAGPGRRGGGVRLVRDLGGAGRGRLGGEMRPEPEDGREFLRDLRRHAAQPLARCRPSRRGVLAGEHLDAAPDR